MNAQFDVDLARSAIQHEPLNEWLFDCVSELTAAVAVDRFRTAPESAWKMVPLHSEVHPTGDCWLRDKIVTFVGNVQDRVRLDANISVAGEFRRLSEIVYEVEELEGLVDRNEAAALKPTLVFLSSQVRDGEGRWRDVLNDLGCTELIGVAEALKILDFDDKYLSRREATWFIRLVRAGLDQGLGQTLRTQRSIITRDKCRIVPPLAHVEGDLLIRAAHTRSLAVRLGLARIIHPAYLTENPDAVIVRTWLEKQGMLRDKPDDDSLLRVLATRGKENEPIVIDDESLRLLRNALEGIKRETATELGGAIGRAISLEVQQWKNGKPVTETASPSLAYLPGRIEDRKDGWSKAAARTPGIKWIHPRYEKVLRRSSRFQRKGGLAARALFRLLGAEDAPRMFQPGSFETRHNDPAFPIVNRELAPSQRSALAELNPPATHFKNERLCPDLVVVLEDIQKERSRSRRRERAKSLLMTLDREWDRLYALSLKATAVYSDRSWQMAGVVPTNWIARLRDEPWLTNETGEPCRPPELAVRTPAAEAIFGDNRGLFAYEIDQTLARSRLVRALGLTVEPHVSEIVEELKELRDQGENADLDRVKLLYAALSLACKRQRFRPSNRVDDLTLQEFRACFGTGRSKRGLIFSGGRWLPPSSVFLGAPIFGHRRTFVPEKPAADLWKVLDIARPTIRDCFDVLAEVAQSEPEGDDQAVLVRTYQYLETKLLEASRRDQSCLARLPLWTGAKWVRSRPVYLAHDPAITSALSDAVPVWQIPIAVSAAPQLLAAVNATLLDETRFTPAFHERSSVDGGVLQQRFSIAVRLLQDWLARHDRKLAQAHTVSWEDLAASRIAIDPRLQLECRISRRPPIIINARAHLTRNPLTFYFADSEAVGDDGAGGRLVASLFTDGDQEKLALAWSRSWQRATMGEVGEVALAEDIGDTSSVAELLEQAKRTMIPPRLPSGKQIKAGVKAPSRPLEDLPVRRLKTLGELTKKSVELVNDGETSGPRKGRPRGLRTTIPPGRGFEEGRRPAPSSAPIAYSEQEKEELALHVLQQAINGDAADLRDYHHYRGVGADALDKLRRYFEVKASYGAMPDEVTLTANEAERALREGNAFFLAVVAGLEQGYDTVVRIISNPLRELQVKPKTSVTLTGIGKSKAAIEVRFSGKPQ